MLSARRIILVAVLILLLAAGVASAWTGDFLEADSSGNGTYEAMAIAPSALYDSATDTTVLAYQGKNLDPYVCTYNHSTEEWSEPVRVGSNASLAASLDTHGGPSLIQDDDGFYHVFWGAHNTRLLHATSVTSHTATAWVEAPVLVEGQSVPCTYPRPEIEADGSLRVWIRRGGPYETDPSLPPKRGDMLSIVTTDGATWAYGETAIEASDTAVWYGNVHTGDSGRRHMVAIKAPRENRTRSADAFVRENIYYMYTDDADPSDGFEWRESGGATVTVPATLESLEGSCSVITSETVNQVVIKELQGGSPGVLYLQEETATPEPYYEWRFIRLDGSSWTSPTVIVRTDNFFDAGDFAVAGDGSIHAYLVTGGEPDSQARVDGTFPLWAARGGDIAHYSSDDAGDTWSDGEWIKQSDGPNVRFNDPLVIPGADDDGRMMFCEWNTDASGFFHKVFLWGDDGLVGREITPEIQRVAGANRVGTAVQAAQTGYSAVAPTVFLARMDDYPDTLCGVPLAHAYRAPILLTPSHKLDEAVRDELLRLKPEHLVVLGGEASVSAQTLADAVATIQTVVDPGDLVVERFEGTDRYDTARLIADRLRQVRGSSDEVLMASGLDFPDALALSSYAARTGQPILLTKPESIPEATDIALGLSWADDVYIAGGTGAVSQSVEDTLTAMGFSVSRAAGANRYETSQIVTQRGLDANVFGMHRFAVASGQMFPDATSGGWLAARVAGPIMLTRRDYLSPEVSQIIEAEADRVLDVYVMGGPGALSEDVVTELQLRLVGATP